MKGIAQVAKGRVEEAAGVLTGSNRLRARGQTDQAVGRVRQVAEKSVRQVKASAHQLVVKAKSSARAAVAKAKTA